MSTPHPETSPFNWTAYRRFLETARELEFRFLPFREQPGPGGTIHLRHDVDNSLAAAVEMAALENELGVRSTYFCMVRSDNYTILSARSRAQVARIVDLGHWVGLHYIVEPSTVDVVGAVRHDTDLLAEVAGVEPDAFSVHNPSVGGGYDIEVPGLVNAYEERFFRSIRYLSESNMRWRDGPPDVVLRREPDVPFQILIHPFSYVADLASDRDVLLEHLLVKCRELIAENSSGVTELEERPMDIDEVARYFAARRSVDE